MSCRWQITDTVDCKVSVTLIISIKLYYDLHIKLTKRTKSSLDLIWGIYTPVAVITALK